MIVEKNHDVGGTWLENTYPGCRVDNPNHNYSYSFAQRHDWPFHFSTQDVLLDYLQRLRRHVRSAPPHPLRHRGAVGHVVGHRPRTGRCVVINPDSTEETIVADAVISAVGQLNRPSMPDIPGRDPFAGPCVPLGPVGPLDRPHRQARRRHRHRRRARCSSSPRSRRRSASCWCSSARRRGSGPTPDYHDAVAAGLAWLYGHVPSYSEWNRFWIFWRMGDGALQNVRVDPSYEPSSGRRHGGEPEQRVRPVHVGRVHQGRVRRPARPARARGARLSRPARSGCCATTAFGRARSSATTSRW